MTSQLPFWKDYYIQFKNHPDQCRVESFAHGKEKGKKLMEGHHINPGGLESILNVINAYMQDVNQPPSAAIEGDRVVYRRERAFCEIMTAALSFGQPWSWVCENVAWPFMKGIASAADSKAMFKVMVNRATGGTICQHYWYLAAD